MQSISDFIKMLLPNIVLKKIRPIGHGFLAYWGSWYFSNPSGKLKMIGVTGTAGKSTTAQMLAKILNENGKKTGYITTVGFFDGKKGHLNRHGLSMPGGMLMHRSLQEILDNGCEYAILECTSEGLEQNRHLGIDFDLVLLTNMFEAHLETHGGYENYRKAKLKLFEALSNSKKEKKTIGVNLESKDYSYFLAAEADYKFGYLFGDVPNLKQINEVFPAQHSTTGFTLNAVNFELNVPGKFNAQNALAAVSTANILGVELAQAANSIANFGGILGRMQRIENDKGFDIYIDYAPEPVGMLNMLETLSTQKHKRLIHVFGSTGGHRDVAKRSEFGKISAKYSNVIIITNDDVYDSDPLQIAEDIKKGIDSVGKKEVHVILDRRDAIKEALSIANKGDIVVFSGKGSEQFLVLPGNKRVQWDEKSVIEEYLK